MTLESNVPADSGMARRRALLYGAAGAVAGLAGAAVAWNKWRDPAQPQRVEPGFWRESFETPTGAPLPMEGLRGRPLLLNFWATWCPPCVEELPLLDAFYQKNSRKSWQVVGLAIDQPSAVRTFLQKTPVSFPIGFAGMSGTELSRKLGNESGGLPYTVVVGASGEVLERRMGRVTAEDLAQWVRLAST